MDGRRKEEESPEYVKLDMESEVTQYRNDMNNTLLNSRHEDVYAVDDHMCGSILSCIFCFTAIGIIAIVRSLAVRDYKMMGNAALAQVASKSAKKMIRLSILIGVILLVVMMVLTVMEIKMLQYVTKTMQEQPNSGQ